MKFIDKILIGIGALRKDDAHVWWHPAMWVYVILFFVYMILYYLIHGLIEFVLEVKNTKWTWKARKKTR
ncbi:MAG: hypothetical protein R2800_09985 [Flavipsychrobacter sp.]